MQATTILDLGHSVFLVHGVVGTANTKAVKLSGAE